MGANPREMEKNQAALDAGRYEIENRQFYHPSAAPGTEGEAGQDVLRRESRLNSFLQKATRPLSGMSGAGDEQPTEPPRERQKLRKRSSSRLGRPLHAVRE
jgi:hypothetical protein